MRLPLVLEGDEEEDGRNADSVKLPGEPAEEKIWVLHDL